MVGSALIGKEALCSMKEGSEGIINVTFQGQVAVLQEQNHKWEIKIQFCCYSGEDDINFLLTTLNLYCVSWL